MIPSMAAPFQLPIHLGYNYMREGFLKKKTASAMIDSFTSNEKELPVCPPVFPQLAEHDVSPALCF
jgi:hypothetical protein